MVDLSDPPIPHPFLCLSSHPNRPVTTITTTTSSLLNPVYPSFIHSISIIKHHLLTALPDPPILPYQDESHGPRGGRAGKGEARARCHGDSVAGGVGFGPEVLAGGAKKIVVSQGHFQAHGMWNRKAISILFFSFLFLLYFFFFSEEGSRKKLLTGVQTNEAFAMVFTIAKAAAFFSFVWPQVFPTQPRMMLLTA
jgi:hypothetical protein